MDDDQHLEMLRAIYPNDTDAMLEERFTHNKQMANLQRRYLEDKYNLEKRHNETMARLSLWKAQDDYEAEHGPYDGSMDDEVRMLTGAEPPQS